MWAELGRTLNHPWITVSIFRDSGVSYPDFVLENRGRCWWSILYIICGGFRLFFQKIVNDSTLPLEDDYRQHRHAFYRSQLYRKIETGRFHEFYSEIDSYIDTNGRNQKSRNYHWRITPTLFLTFLKNWKIVRVCSFLTSYMWLMKVWFRKLENSSQSFAFGENSWTYLLTDWETKSIDFPI